MAERQSPEGPERPPSHTVTLLRSISEGVRTIITVTERLNDLRTEGVALRSDLQRLAEAVYRIAGRLDGVEQRFTEVDKRLELAVKVAVRDELDLDRNSKDRTDRRLPASKSSEILT